MDIYVVQQDDSIYSIAEKYGVTVEKIAQDNGLNYPYNLVIGQSIIITYPKESYIVQQGDTLISIANDFNVPLMQLLRNNPFLSDQDYLYPGETLVISYDTIKSITSHGFAYPFIRREILIQSLPNLTYLSIFNYSATEEGRIITYQDDTEIIKTSKEYGVIPLLMLTTLSYQGIPNIETSYTILTNVEYQERIINEFISIIKSKGYQGVNVVFNYLNEDNQLLYQKFTERIANYMIKEGFLFFITINYHEEKNLIDYSKLGIYVDGMIFLRFKWGTDYGPPEPVSNINSVNAIIDYVTKFVSPDKIVVGIPYIGYDWQLPYVPNKSSANSISVNFVYSLAYDAGTIIQFDDISQTPYFYYNQYSFGSPIQHIVWFIDARSLNSLYNLIIDKDLNGTGIWNVMTYNPQLWTMINSKFDTIKYDMIG